MAYLILYDFILCISTWGNNLTLLYHDQSVCDYDCDEKDI